jgi:hypothetical protein
MTGTEARGATWIPAHGSLSTAAAGVRRQSDVQAGCCAQAPEHLHPVIRGRFNCNAAAATTHFASAMMNSRWVRLLLTAVIFEAEYFAAMNRLQLPHPHPSSST